MKICTAAHDTHHCSLPAGHDGRHSSQLTPNFQVTWSNKTTNEINRLRFELDGAYVKHHELTDVAQRSLRRIAELERDLVTHQRHSEQLKITRRLLSRSLTVIDTLAHTLPGDELRFGLATILDGLLAVLPTFDD